MAWRITGFLAAACAFLSVAVPVHAAVRAVYVGNEFYPPNAATETLAKQSGFNTLFLFTTNIAANGDIAYNGTTVVSNGVYVGDPTWGNRLAAVKSDGRVTRIELCIGSYGSTAFDNIKALVASQGTGPTSILYKNFLALKNATGVDAIQYDDEQTYHVASAVAFGQMIAGLGLKVTFVPYTAQSFWVNAKRQLGASVDAIYLQCYDGGAGNSPAQWNTAFGNGVKVYPGLWGNTSTQPQALAQFRAWQQSLGMNGGFMWLNGSLPGDAESWSHPLRLSLDPVPYFMLVNQTSGKPTELTNGNTNSGAAVNQNSYDYTNVNQRWSLLPTGDGNHYKLLSWVSGFAFGVSNNSTGDFAPVVAAKYMNNFGQQWDLFDTGNGWFELRNVNSGKALDVSGSSTADGAVIQQYSPNNTGAQRWRFQPQGDYYVVNATSGRDVSIQAGANGNGSPVVQYDEQAGPAFQWRFGSVGAGYYKMASLNALTRALGVIGGSTAAAANTQLSDYTVTTAGAQQVRLLPLTDGHFKFYFAHDGLSFDVPGGQTANNVPLQQSPDSGNLWQRFDLKRVMTSVPVPQAVTGVTVSLIDGRATLNWSADAYANGYNVKRSTTSGGPYTTVASGVGATTYADAGLAYSGTYYYVLSGVSDTGEGANSSQVTAMDGYAQWAQQNGLTPGAAGSGFADVPDGTGVSNGVRYSVPGGLNAAPGASASTLTFDLRTDPSLSVTALVSPDLANWSVAGGTLTAAGDQSGVAAGFTRLIFQDAAGAQAARRFYRLQISR